MVREAEEHADEDRRRREEIDARNELDSLAYQAEQLVERAAGPRCRCTRRRAPSSSSPTPARRSRSRPASTACGR